MKERMHRLIADKTNKKHIGIKEQDFVAARRGGSFLSGICHRIPDGRMGGKAVGAG